MSTATITPSANLDTRSFEFISKFIFDKSAIVLESSKYYLIESRLMPIAREHGMNNIGEIVTALRGPHNRMLSQQVVDAMTTNETSFFRDIHPFDALKAHVLPEMIERRKATRALNIWSNACSSGQEIYSIAMILRENFPVLASWKVRLIASDLSSVILKKAQEGVFNQTEVNRGLPMPMLLKYFKQSGLQWQVSEVIRNTVEFKTINLVEAWPTMPPIDIVFLRNVLIYFDAETKTKILNKVERAMPADGYLFLGGAETTLSLNTNFTRTPIGKTFAYRPGK